jgi:hypothetical protein
MRKHSQAAISLITAVLLLTLFGCQLDKDVNAEESDDSDSEDIIVAEITTISVSGSAGAFTFTVTVQSPDTGCDQYADWWEVLSTDGDLIYRRVLLHSHVSEQPFTRSGGPVDVTTDEVVIVRAHMNTTGYGADAWRGSADSEFELFELPEDFAIGVELLEPLPQSCAF